MRSIAQVNRASERRFSVRDSPRTWLTRWGTDTGYPFLTRGAADTGTVHPWAEPWRASVLIWGIPVVDRHELMSMAKGGL
jgi:hypothetical protein